MKLNLKTLMLGVVASVPFALTGCAPECVDVYDCGAKAKKDGKEYTCVAGACVTGSPFPDAGSGETGGGGGETGGGGGATGGGGGATGGGGGGGGMDEDAGMDAGTEDAGMDAGMDVDAGMDAGMDVDAGMDAGMDVDAGMDAGMDVDAGTTDEQITAVRAAADSSSSAMGLTIHGAVVTYLKPVVADAGVDDPAGFFIQATQNGPGLFVAIDPSTVAGGLSVGNLVDLTVDTVAKANGLRQITAITAASKATTTPDPIPGLIASINAVDFFTATNLDIYESRLISVTGTVTADPSGAGNGYKSARFNTTGTPDAGTRVALRLPSALMDAQFFGPGCTFTLTGGPMWRFTTTAQPSGFVQTELTNVACPGPAVIDARSITSTSVLVNFSRDLAPASVTASAFSITASDGGVLSVTAAANASARSVSLTTDAQLSAEPYTLVAGPALTDLRGTAVGTPNSATFTGFVSTNPGTHLLLTEVDVASAAEFIEIYNPTSQPIDLRNYYLADVNNYFELPANPTARTLTDNNDFLARFPAGATIGPKQTVVVAISGTAFNTAYPAVTSGVYSINSTGTTTAMEFIWKSAAPTPGLTNGGELVALVFWDGLSDNVKDVDIVLAGNPSATNNLVAKTPVDGPDTGTATTAYATDARTIQTFATTAGSGFSYKRNRLEGTNEVLTGGNGIDGNDETSEQTRTTWDTTYTAPTPGVVPTTMDP